MLSNDLHLTTQLQHNLGANNSLIEKQQTQEAPTVTLATSGVLAGQAWASPGLLILGERPVSMLGTESQGWSGAEGRSFVQGMWAGEWSETNWVNTR